MTTNQRSESVPRTEDGPSPAARPAAPDGVLPFAGPARWLAAVALLLGGGLQLVEFLLEPASADVPARLAWWSAHPVRMDWSQASGLAAVAFLLFGIFVMWRLCRDDSRVVAALAAAMLGCAMIGLGFVHGLELAARFALLAGQSDAAQVILVAADPRLPGIVGMIMFLPTAALGNVLLAVALFRARYVPRFTAILPIAFVVLDFVAGLGIVSHLAEFTMGLVVGWAVVSGYRRTRRARAVEASH